MAESPVALMRQLHDEHAAALWGYCLRLTGHDRARAEDVVQETLLRAWRDLPPLSTTRQASARAWLFTVARNIVIDDWRTKRSQSEVSVADVPDGTGEADRTDQVLLSWVVADALARLSAEHRAVLRRVLLPRAPRGRGRRAARAARRDREVADALRAASLAARAGGDGGGRHEPRPLAHDDAAYVLGALPPPERLAFERHLADCPECDARGAPSRRLPGLLGRLTLDDVESAPAPEPVPVTLLPRLVDEVRRVQRRRRWTVGLRRGRRRRGHRGPRSDRRRGDVRGRAATHGSPPRR